MARPGARVIVTVLVAASLGGWRLGAARSGEPGDAIVGTRRAALVVEVIDGDTIVVVPAGATGADAGGGSGPGGDPAAPRETVRLLGIDTPETRHPNRPVECFGPQAAEHARRRLLGRRVVLEADVEPVDRYGRTLAHVELDGERFGDELLALGYARLLVIAPNHRHARAMLAIELAARSAGAGLWSAC